MKSCQGSPFVFEKWLEAKKGNLEGEKFFFSFCFLEKKFGFRKIINKETERSKKEKIKGNKN